MMKEKKAERERERADKGQREKGRKGGRFVSLGGRARRNRSGGLLVKPLIVMNSVKALWSL